jgi:hypothetical protein
MMLDFCGIGLCILAWWFWSLVALCASICVRWLNSVVMSITFILLCAIVYAVDYLKQ